MRTTQQIKERLDCVDRRVKELSEKMQSMTAEERQAPLYPPERGCEEAGANFNSWASLGNDLAERDTLRWVLGIK